MTHDVLAGGSRCRRPRRTPGQPQIRRGAEQHGLSMASGRQGRGGRGARLWRKHVTRIDLVNNRLIPKAAIERAPSAIGELRLLQSSSPSTPPARTPTWLARGCPAPSGVAPEHKLRVVAPDVGGGFGSKIFIYAEETVCLWASRKVGRPVKWMGERTEAFLADAHGRDHVTNAPSWRSSQRQDGGAAGQDHRQPRRVYSTFASGVPDSPSHTPCIGQSRHRRHLLARWMGLHHTVPVDAYRGAGRPEATFVVVERLVEVAARE